MIAYWLSPFKRLLPASHLATTPTRGQNSTPTGIRNVIRLLGVNNEKVRRLKAEDLVDDSLVRKLEKEGRF